MKKLFKTLALTAALSALSLTAMAAEPALHQTVTNPQALAVQSAGTENFTGEVMMAAIYGPQAPSKSYAATVTFAPGARTYWHVHEMGQTLIVTSGIGYTQEWGKAPVMLKPGDIVRCPPGVKHWHGAAPHSSMTHLALSEAGGTVTWLEEVSAKDYPSE